MWCASTYPKKAEPQILAPADIYSPRSGSRRVAAGADGRAALARGDAAATRPQKESELLFPSEVGGYRSPSSLDKPFAAVAKAIQLKKRITPRGDATSVPRPLPDGGGEGRRGPLDFWSRNRGDADPVQLRQ